MEARSQTQLSVVGLCPLNCSCASPCDETVWWSPVRNGGLPVHGCTFTLNHGMLLFLFSKLFPTNTFDFCQRWKTRAALWALYMFVMSLKICVSLAADCSLLAYGKWDATVNQKISLKHEKNLQTAYTSHGSDLKPASWERHMFKSARSKTANIY